MFWFIGLIGLVGLRGLGIHHYGWGVWVKVVRGMGLIIAVMEIASVIVVRVKVKGREQLY